jgi:ring-1,2-phenylacetyl-CoA epoxidase subunit PaaD
VVNSEVLSTNRTAQAWAALATVLDPEVPALSICDLGIVREVHDLGDTMQIVLTPTYSGCPATEVIEQAAVSALQAAGMPQVDVQLRRLPAWTTDWISDDGRRKLAEYGIAPPGPALADGDAPLRFHGRKVTAEPACPRCASARTERLAAFGSTACKALYRCLACREPFEHFKPI